MAFLLTRLRNIFTDQAEHDEDEPAQNSWISRIRNSFGLKRLAIIAVVLVGVIIVLSVSIAVPLNATSGERTSARTGARTTDKSVTHGKIFLLCNATSDFFSYIIFSWSPSISLYSVSRSS